MRLIICNFKHVNMIWLFFTVLMFVYSADLTALTTVRIAAPQIHDDKRFAHKIAVLNRALEITEAQYGSFVIQSELPLMRGKRMVEGVTQGDIINVSITPYSKEWHDSALEVTVPIRGSALSYRLLLIHKEDIKQYENITSINDLKNLTAGVVSNWITKDIIQYHGLPFIEGNNYDGLFMMLENHRFNYILRGVYEIFDELEERKNNSRNLIIEPNLAIFVPSYTLIYVSPKYPELAARLQQGLLLMLDNGDLERIFNIYYRQDIEKADIKNRRILHMNTPPETTFTTDYDVDFVLPRTKKQIIQP